MKTVIDAVNEFKGKWPYNDSIVVYFTKGANGYGFYSKGYRDNAESAITSEKFNELVSQMETNFGRVTHGEHYDYIHASKVLLTKDLDKELGMDIDWSKAPDGATHYDVSPDVYPWIKEDDNGNKFWHHNEWVNYIQDRKSVV